ncbi:hypothetical protein [Streptomyces sp. NPDC059863]|uniref:hypothetical protein n=1 Tax=unclassified Streptomyces TaxID=2593676 RepID=UPI003668065B
MGGDRAAPRAQIVGVMVSESPSQDDPGAVMRPWRKRDEMWPAIRSLLQPDPSWGRGRLRLHVDKKAATKKAMRARGMKSPDRAEAVLLALYEPEPLYKPRRRGLLN